LTIPLVLLPGALGAMEGTRRLAEGLADSRPTAPLGYSPDDSLESLMARVLAAGGDDRFDLFGQSLGGWIAQCVARRHPDRVRRLILSHSFVLRPSDAWRVRLLGAALGLPRGLLRHLMLARIRRALEPVRNKRPDLYAARLATIEAGLAGDLIHIFRAQQRCTRRSLARDVASLPPVAPDLPVLIIDSDNDPVIGGKARARLRAAFPEAQLLHFADAGHSASSLHGEAVLNGVRAFLDA
jgi:pimeloyl-ACP methyl ester carboxylesterase